MAAGELLALRNRAVATALAAWKHANLAAVALRLERQVLRERLGGVLDLSDDPAATDAAHVRDATATALTALPLTDPEPARHRVRPPAGSPTIPPRTPTRSSR